MLTKKIKRKTKKNKLKIEPACPQTNLGVITRIGKSASRFKNTSISGQMTFHLDLIEHNETDFAKSELLMLFPLAMQESAIRFGYQCSSLTFITCR